MSVLPACVCVPCTCLVHRKVRRGSCVPWNCSYRWLWASTSVLATQPGSSARATSISNCWAISLPLAHHFDSGGNLRCTLDICSSDTLRPYRSGLKSPMFSTSIRLQSLWKSLFWFWKLCIWCIPFLWFFSFNSPAHPFCVLPGWSQSPPNTLVLSLSRLYLQILGGIP